MPDTIYGVPTVFFSYLIDIAEPPTPAASTNLPIINAIKDFLYCIWLFRCIKKKFIYNLIIPILPALSDGRAYLCRF